MDVPKLLGALCLWVSLAPPSLGENYACVQPDLETTRMLLEEQLWRFQQCRAAHDCVVTEGLCGQPVAVAAEHRQCLGVHAARLNEVMDCIAPPDHPALSARCVARRCVLVTE